MRCALLTALDIAEALKFMHKSTTLHGDLKPHNILLVTDLKVGPWSVCMLFACGRSHHHQIPC
jgi:serine/threonine protein kinase